MEVVEEIPVTRKVSAPPRKRRCPECDNYLFLEMVYGEGYWWSCLMCGWHQPAEVRKVG